MCKESDSHWYLMMRYPFLSWIALPKSDPGHPNSRFDWTIVFEKKSESSLVYNKWNDKEHSLHYWREAVQWLDFGTSKFMFFFGFVEPWTIASIFEHSTYCSEIYYWMKFLFKASAAESTLKFLVHFGNPCTSWGAITLFSSITVLCGIDSILRNIPHIQIECGEYSA